MLTESTAAKLDAAVARIREAQDAGLGPMPGEWSRAELARAAGISEEPIRRIEAIFRARLVARLLKDPDTRPLARKYLRHLPRH